MSASDLFGDPVAWTRWFVKSTSLRHCSPAPLAAKSFATSGGLQHHWNQLVCGTAPQWGDQVMVAVARTWSTLSACFGTVFGLAEECMPSDFSAFLQFFTTKIHHSTTSQQLFHPAWKGSSKARLSKTAQFSCRLPGIEKRLACRVIGGTTFAPLLEDSKCFQYGDSLLPLDVFASC